MLMYFDPITAVSWRPKTDTYLSCVGFNSHSSCRVGFTEAAWQTWRIIASDSKIHGLSIYFFPMRCAFCSNYSRSPDRSRFYSYVDRTARYKQNENPEKMRILCLHGLGNNSEIMKHKISQILQHSDLSWELYYLQGNEICPPAPGKY